MSKRTTAVFLICCFTMIAHARQSSADQLTSGQSVSAAPTAIKSSRGGVANEAGLLPSAQTVSPPAAANEAGFGNPAGALPSSFPAANAPAETAKQGDRSVATPQQACPCSKP